MTRTAQLAGVALAAMIAGAASAQIFTDDLSTGTNWTVVGDADTASTFGYDYSADGVPAAPNGGDTVGLKLEVNNNSPAAAAEIGVFNLDAAYTGQFTFRVDVWSNWAPDGGGVGAGTTEFIGGAVGHDAFAPGPFGGTFLYTGDGDAAATDYRLYKDTFQLQSESGQYALGDMAGARDHTNPIIEAAFPEIDIATAVPAQGSTGTNRAGAAGFQWMTLNFEVDTDAIGPSGETANAGFARVSMRSDSSGNILDIGTIDNSLAAETPTIFSGSIGLLMSDLFSSVTVNPAFSFGLFDNVTVLSGLVPLAGGGTPLLGDADGDGDVDGDDLIAVQTEFGNTASVAVPEPGAVALLLAAGIGLAARRR